MSKPLEETDNIRLVAFLNKITELPSTAANGMTVDKINQLRDEAIAADKRYHDLLKVPNLRAKDFTKQRKKLADIAMQRVNKFLLAYYGTTQTRPTNQTKPNQP